MKITMASGPMASLGQPSGSDRLANAKAIAAGQTQPEPPLDPQVARLQNNLKRIKMRTQVSPDRIEESPLPPEPEATTPTEVTTQSAISDTSVEAPAADEIKPLSPQFAALARQRRALQQERAKFEQEKAEHAKTATGALDMARLKSEPLRVLEEAGVTYEQLTDAILAGSSNPAASEIKALKAEIEALKSGVDSKFTERDTQAEQQVLSEIKREAEGLVASSDEYKYTRAMKKAPDASRLIHEHWKKTGEVWDTSYALELIEAECKKEYDALMNALADREQKERNDDLRQVKPQGMRTLTNKDTARPQMSRRDRMIAAFRGELKK